MVDIGRKQERATIEQRVALVASDPFVDTLVHGDSQMYHNPTGVYGPMEYVTEGNVVGTETLSFYRLSSFTGDWPTILDTDHPTATSVLLGGGHIDMLLYGDSLLAMQGYINDVVNEVCTVRGFPLIIVSYMPIRSSGLFDIDKENILLALNAWIELTLAAGNSLVTFCDTFHAGEDPFAPNFMLPAYEAASTISYTEAGAQNAALVIDAAIAGLRTSDPFGDVDTDTWETVMSRFCSVRTVTGREYLAQERTRAEISHRFWFMHSSAWDDVKPDTHRILWRGDYYDIKNVLPDEDRTEIEILASRVY